MVEKVNICLRKELLEKLDKAAKEAKSSRSALLSRAVESFLEQKEQERKRDLRLKASQRIEEIAEKIGPWDGTEEILKWRRLH